MNYLLVFADGNITSRNTITDADREEVELGNLEVFQFSCNFMHFTQLKVESYVDEPDEDRDDDDYATKIHWEEDKWLVVK